MKKFKFNWRLLLSVALTLALLITGGVYLYFNRDRLPQFVDTRIPGTILTSSGSKAFHGYSIAIPDSYQTSVNQLQLSADHSKTDQMVLIDKSYVKNQDTFIPYVRLEFFNVTPTTKDNLKAWVQETFLTGWSELQGNDEAALGYRFEDNITVGNTIVITVYLKSQSDSDVIKAFMAPNQKNAVIVVHQLSTGQSTVESQELAAKVQEQVIGNINLK